MPSREEALKKLGAKASLFKEVFKTPEGERALKALEDEFITGNLTDLDNPNVTYWKLGGRDVVVYIRQLIESDERLNNEPKKS